jgi:hypothetical protein
MDSGRQPSRPRGSTETSHLPGPKASCLMSYTHITIKSAPSMHTPSHHIRAFSASFHSTEILDPETVPDSDLGPCTAQLWTTRDMRTRERGSVSLGEKLTSSSAGVRNLFFLFGVSGGRAPLPQGVNVLMGREGRGGDQDPDRVIHSPS